MSRLQRLDAELVRRRLADSRQHAADLIRQGQVSINGLSATKPATAVRTAAPIVVRSDEQTRYASRGAYKLLGALEAFEPHGLSVASKKCLDAGASTGGFTDVLLRRDVGSVYAVDVGYGQLDWAIRSDHRVHVIERTNIRHLTDIELNGKVQLIVSDLSFISLTIVMDALARVCQHEGDMVLMIKPQFEVGKDRIGKGGVVRDSSLHRESINAVCVSAATVGWKVAGIEPSPLPGPSGNIEYFVWLRTDALELRSEMVHEAVEAAHGGGHE